jgi:hypothetical protein
MFIIKRTEEVQGREGEKRKEQTKGRAGWVCDI